MEVGQLLDTAIGHHQRGALDEATALYEQVLQLDPDNANALHLIGLIAHQRGQADLAIERIGQAIAANPAAPVFYINLASILEQRGDLAGAQDVLRDGTTAAEGQPELHAGLGRLQQRLGRRAEAVGSFRQALQLAPNNVGVWVQLAAVLFELGRLPEAEAACRQALGLDPGNQPALLQLAAALNLLERPEEALQCLAGLDADAGAASLRGAALLSLGDVEGAIAGFREALTLAPDFAPAHHNLSLALLLKGNFEEGWREYEWRGATALFEARRGLPQQPLWQGEPLNGKRLLVHAEQGLGDAIQFARFLPRLEAADGRIVLECLAPLERLFRTLAGAQELVSVEDPLPEYDVRIPLLSLPRVLGSTLESDPYLAADPELVESWRARLAGPEGTIKAGLVWAGSPSNAHDLRRSMPPTYLARLANIQGVKLYSLQKDVPPPAGLRCTDLAPELGDFADTAAAVACLDLVISVDTAVAHLAGAMGRPVWVLLAYTPDWRWQLGREDSPWYPTARLFRQPSKGDWLEVVLQVRRELETLATGAYRRRREGRPTSDMSQSLFES